MTAAGSRGRAWVAGTASFVVPGLGQLIGGRFARAGVLLALQALTDTVALACFLAPPGAASLVLPVVVIIVWRSWAARDAFRVNRGSAEARTRHAVPAWVAAVAAFAVAVYAVGEVTTFVRWRLFGESFRLPAASMAPTLLAGDWLLTRPLGDGPVRRGEIVVFHWPMDTTQSWMKRVVGVPGDTLAMRGGVLVVNGRPQREAYAVRDTFPDVTGEEFRWQEKHLAGGVRQVSAYQPSRDNWGPIVVPDDSYFVLGDNRDNSLDSRYWGFVGAGQLFARPWRIYFSRDPETGRMRWKRIGRSVRSASSDRPDGPQ